MLIEPLALSPRLRAQDSRASESNLARLYRVHLVLLAFILITVLSAVAGTHGETP